MRSFRERLLDLVDIVVQEHEELQDENVRLQQQLQRVKLASDQIESSYKVRPCFNSAPPQISIEPANHLCLPSDQGCLKDASAILQLDLLDSETIPTRPNCSAVRVGHSPDTLEARLPKPGDSLRKGGLATHLLPAPSAIERAPQSGQNLRISFSPSSKKEESEVPHMQRPADAAVSRVSFNGVDPDSEEVSSNYSTPIHRPSTTPGRWSAATNNSVHGLANARSTAAGKLRLDELYDEMLAQQTQKLHYVLGGLRPQELDNLWQNTIKAEQIYNILAERGEDTSLDNIKHVIGGLNRLHGERGCRKSERVSWGADCDMSVTKVGTNRRSLTVRKRLASLLEPHNSVKSNSFTRNASGLSSLSPFPDQLQIGGNAFMDLITKKDLEKFVGPENVETAVRIRSVLIAKTAETLMIGSEQPVKPPIMSFKGIKHRVRRIQSKVNWLEIAVVFLIILNIALIGVRTEVNTNWIGWNVVDGIFALLFTLEMYLRIRMTGIWAHFTGESWKWNTFDAVVVILGLVDVCTLLVEGDMSTSDYTVVRIIRLTRVTRVFRLLHLSIFKEFTDMVAAMCAGMKTLFWGMVFLLLLVYFGAVILTQTMGRNPIDMERARLDLRHVYSEFEQYREEYFSTVLRSMFTIFRCVTQDCTDFNGKPLILQLQEIYGPIVFILYGSVSQIVSWGLFELVGAVFVANTVRGRKLNAKERRTVREQHKRQVTQKSRRLIQKLITLKTADYNLPSDSDWLRDGSGMLMISREFFERALEEPEVQELLEDLDLDESDWLSMFNALDMNGNGVLELTELADGIARLRGKARGVNLAATQSAVIGLESRVRNFEVLALELLNEMKEMLVALHGRPIEQSNQSGSMFLGEGRRSRASGRWSSQPPQGNRRSSTGERRSSSASNIKRHSLAESRSSSFDKRHSLGDSRSN